MDELENENDVATNDSESSETPDSSEQSSAPQQPSPGSPPLSESSPQVPNLQSQAPNKDNSTMPAWSSVRDQWMANFPDLSEDRVRGTYEGLAHAADWRERLRNSEERTGSWFYRRSLPFASTQLNVRNARYVDQARQRIATGQGTSEDAEVMAVQHRLQETDRNAPTSTRIAGAIAGIPATLGEAYAGGRILRPVLGFFGIGAGAAGAGIGSQTAASGIGRALASRFAQGAVATPLMPSLYAERAIENNRAEGRSATDWRGFPSAITLAAIQNGVFSTVKVNSSAGGSGAVATTRRVFTNTARAMALQQGMDIGTSALDDASSHVFGQSLGLTTHYGIVGSLVRGEGDDALRDGLTQALTMALFAGLHEAQRRPSGQDLVPISSPGLPPDSPLARDYVQVRGVRTNRPTPETPAARRLAGPAIMEGTQAYLNEMGRQGLTPEAAGVNLRTVTSAVGNLLTNADQQGITRTTARNILETQFPPGPARDYAMHLVERLSGFAEIPAPSARPSGGLGVPERPAGPTPMSEPNRLPGFMRPSEGPTPPLPRPRSEPTQMPGFMRPQPAATPAPEGAWRNTGTRFRETGGGLQFAGRNGETYHMTENFIQPGERPSAPNGGVILRVHDSEGREVGHVGMFRNEQGHWQGEGLRVDPSVRDSRTQRTGVAAAMYDYIASQGEHVVPSGGQTPEGKRFWQRNRAPEQAAAPPSPRPISEPTQRPGFMRPQEGPTPPLPRPKSEPTRRPGFMAAESSPRTGPPSKGALARRPAELAPIGKKTPKPLVLTPQLRRQWEGKLSAAGLPAATLGPKESALQRARIAAGLPVRESATLRPRGRHMGEQPIAESVANAIRSAALPEDSQKSLEGVLSGNSSRALKETLGASHQTVLNRAAKAWDAIVAANPDIREQWPTIKTYMLGQQTANVQALIAGASETANDRKRGRTGSGSMPAERIDNHVNAMIDAIQAAEEERDLYREEIERKAKDNGLTRNAIQRLVEGASPAELAARRRALGLGQTQAPQTTAPSQTGAAGKIAPAQTQSVGPAQGAASIPTQPNLPAAAGGPGSVSPPWLQQFLADESGHLDLELLHDVAMQYGQKLQRAVRHVRDNVAELRNEMGPRTTRLSRAAGEALARLNVADTYARFAVPVLTDKVLGGDDSLAFRLRVGGYLTERRLRFMRNYYYPHDLAASRRVISIIGKPNSPFKSVADYREAHNDPAVVEAVKRYEKYVVPLMDDAFRRSQGMEIDDPLNSATQIPGSPINLKSYKEGETPSATTVRTREGSLRNEKLHKSKFAHQAYGDADNYELDIAPIIEHSLTNQLPHAAKAELVRTMVDRGIAEWGKPGEAPNFSATVPGGPTRGVGFEMKPPPGTQESLAGESRLYVHPEAANEFRRSLRVDEKLEFETFKMAMQALTTGTLASTAELVYHLKNQLAFLFKPGVRPWELFRHFHDVIMKKPEIMDSLVELARIGTMKEHGLEGGVLGGKYSPFKYGGRFLDLTRKVLVLMGDNAYDRLVDAGLAKDTQTGRRDFINQLGQYNRFAANKIVKFLRDTQIGPFATAAVNAPIQSVRSLLGGHGVTTTSRKADLQLRAATIAKYVGLLATTAIVNNAVWGTLTGSDDTPLGGLRVGTSPDGRSRYIDVLDLIGLKRGLRVLGLLALFEGKRTDDLPGKIFDRASGDVLNGLIHPAAGPGVQFGLTGAFGVDARGVHVAEHAHPGESQRVSNLKAAAIHANPLIGTFLGHKQSEKSGFEKGMELLGPFGIKTAPPRR